MGNQKEIDYLINTPTYINIRYTAYPLGWKNLIASGTATEGDIIIDETCFPYGAMHTHGHTFYFFNPEQYAEDLANQYFCSIYPSYTNDSDISAGIKNIDLDNGYLKADAILTNYIGIYDGLGDPLKAITINSSDMEVLLDNTYFHNEVYFKNSRYNSLWNALSKLYNDVELLKISIDDKVNYSYIELLNTSVYENRSDIADILTDIELLSDDVCTLADTVDIYQYNNESSIYNIGRELILIEHNISSLELQCTSLNTSITEVYTELRNALNVLSNKLNVIDTSLANAITENEKSINRVNIEVSTFIGSTLKTFLTIELRFNNISNSLYNTNTNITNNTENIQNINVELADLKSKYINANTLVTLITTSLEWHDRRFKQAETSINDLENYKADTIFVNKQIESLRSELATITGNAIDKLLNDTESETNALKNNKVNQSVFDSSIAEIKSILNDHTSDINKHAGFINKINTSIAKIDTSIKLIETASETYSKRVDTSIKKIDASVIDISSRTKLLESITTTTNINNIIQTYYDSTLSSLIENADYITSLNTSCNNLTNLYNNIYTFCNHLDVCIASNSSNIAGLSYEIDTINSMLSEINVSDYVTNDMYDTLSSSVREIKLDLSGLKELQTMLNTSIAILETADNSIYKDISTLKLNMIDTSTKISELLEELGKTEKNFVVITDASYNDLKNGNGGVLSFNTIYFII